MRRNRKKRKSSKPPVTRSTDLKLYRSFCFYGVTGTGKTTLACTFPKPLLLLDIADEGMESIVDVDDIDIAHCRSWADVEEWYWYLKEHPNEYATVVFDTISQWQTLAIKKILEDRGKATERAGEFGTVTLQEYGDVAQELKIGIIDWRDLPMNVVFLAQDRLYGVTEEEEDADTGAMPWVGPQMMPRVARDLMAAVSVLGNTTTRTTTVEVKIRRKTKKVDKEVYSLRLGLDPAFRTKVQKPKKFKVPEFVDDPSYDDIMAIMQGEYRDGS